jgi:hypothetical protein
MPIAARKAESTVYYRDLCEKNRTREKAYLTLDSALSDGYNTPCAAEKRHTKQHMAA